MRGRRAGCDHWEIAGAFKALLGAHGHIDGAKDQYTRE
jgi:hypothetical protein